MGATATVPRLPRLRSLRNAKLMTQGDLSERSGVSRQTINRIEQGELEARFKTVRDLADALNVRPSQLLGPTIEDAFDQWCEDLEWDRGRLAAWLELTPEALDALADEPRQRIKAFMGIDGRPTQLIPPIGWKTELAMKHGANVERFHQIMEGWN